MAQASTVISMRLPVGSGERLKKLAQRFGWTPSDTSARLVEEGLRRTEFAFLDFRNSSLGRMACVQGSSLAVWEVVSIARGYGHEAGATARHLSWPEEKVRAAFNYARAYPEEVEPLIAQNDAADFESLAKMLPKIEPFVAGGKKKAAAPAPRRTVKTGQR